MKHIRALICISLLFVVVGCSKKADDSKDADDTLNDGEVITNSQPSDSTGAEGSVALGFGSTSESLSLTEGEAASVKIGDSIVIDQALLNIAKIKLKADVTPSDEEKALDQKEADEEKVAASEVEATAEAALADDADAKPSDTPERSSDGATTGKEKRDAQRAKIAAKKDELAAKEKAQLDKELQSDKSAKFAGPYLFNAVTGEVEGDLPAVDVTDGSYRRIEFQLKRSFDDRMLGDVMYIHGTVAKDGAEVPFEIEWQVALNFRLSGTGAFQVAPGADNKLAIRLDLAKWFDGVDLTQATVDADGTIYVNKTSNHDVMKQLHKNIKASCRFGKDGDGDGKLATTESAGEGQDTSDASAE